MEHIQKEITIIKDFYIANDGKSFEDSHDCEMYELNLEHIENLKKKSTIGITDKNWKIHISKIIDMIYWNDHDCYLRLLKSDFYDKETNRNYNLFGGDRIHNPYLLDNLNLNNLVRHYIFTLTTLLIYYDWRLTSDYFKKNKDDGYIATITHFAGGVGTYRTNLRLANFVYNYRSINMENFSKLINYVVKYDLIDLNLLGDYQIKQAFEKHAIKLLNSKNRLNLKYVPISFIETI
jgi:hypothetical protein